MRNRGRCSRCGYSSAATKSILKFGLGHWALYTSGKCTHSMYSKRLECSNMSCTKGQGMMQLHHEKGCRGHLGCRPNVDSSHELDERYVDPNQTEQVQARRTKMKERSL